MSTDFITGDPVDVQTVGNQLALVHTHDLDDVDTITLDSLADIAEVAVAAVRVLSRRAAVAAERARCGMAHEPLDDLSRSLAAVFALAGETRRAITAAIGHDLRYEELAAYRRAVSTS